MSAKKPSIENRGEKAALCVEVRIRGKQYLVEPTHEDFPIIKLVPKGGFEDEDTYATKRELLVLMRRFMDRHTGRLELGAERRDIKVREA